MAYFSQERKKEMQPKIKALLKEYNMKGSLSVRDCCKVILTLKEGVIDFGTENEDVNTYYIERNYNGVARDFLQKAKAILNSDNFDNSDSQTDYFHVGWYADIRIGKWDKPYKKVA